MTSEQNADINDEFVKNALEEIQRVFSAEVVNYVYAKVILNNTDAEKVADERKKELVGILLASTWNQRLYFIVRSSIMSLMGAIITLAIIWYLGTINVVQGLVVALIGFVAALFISRLFDKPINREAKRIVDLLKGHDRLKELLTHF
jgi:phosphate/sulfate permease